MTPDVRSIVAIVPTSSSASFSMSFSFVNGAQPIIDEFINSGEAKWGQLSNVVLLLPRGHEGQGPDHTSGSIERFLQLWAEGSMTIAVPSTPSNYFHLLRRHALDGIQRQLIIFTPKSMLRNKVRSAISRTSPISSSVRSWRSPPIRTASATAPRSPESW